MATVDLGIVYEPHPQEFAELRAALSELTGSAPGQERLFGYAGPNDVVQLLLDAATWQNVLAVLAASFGGAFAASFGKELGKLAAVEVWKEKRNYYDAVKRVTASSFLKFVAAIKAMREKDQTVTIAVRIPGTPRNAGLVITSDDPAEIAWQISNVTRCTVAIQRVIFQSPGNPMDGDNPDKSIVIEVLENGDVRVLGVTIQMQEGVDEITEDYLTRQLPHRLNALSIAIVMLQLRLQLEEPKPMQIFIEGRPRFEDLTTLFMNPIFEVGALHARALLEFVGVKADRKTEKLVQVDLKNRNPDDAGIEKMVTPAGTLALVSPKDIGNLGPNAERAVFNLITSVHKGLAHTSTTYSSNPVDAREMLEGLELVQQIVDSHVYRPMGRRRPPVPIETVLRS
jgi:hypothetical protein